MQSLIEFGLLGLFIAAFLAATILPIGSEVLLVALLSNGFNTIEVVAIASIGNLLGSMVNYAIGFYGRDYVIYKLLRISPSSFARAERRFQRWGQWSLLLAWVPIIGDPLTVVAGVMRVKLWIFIILVGLGKTARYTVIALGVNAL